MQASRLPGGAGVAAGVGLASSSRKPSWMWGQEPTTQVQSFQTEARPQVRQPVRQLCVQLGLDLGMVELKSRQRCETPSPDPGGENVPPCQNLTANTVPGMVTVGVTLWRASCDILITPVAGPWSSRGCHSWCCPLGGPCVTRE
jgi:hypothetical protein